MRIISIDPSKRCTGYFIKKGKQETFGTIKNPAKYSNLEVLRTIYDRVKEIIVVNEIQVMIIEGYSFNPKNPVSASILMEIGGVLRLIAAQNEIPVVVIPPQTWKKYTIGRIKKTRKKEYLEAFKLKYGISLKTTDEADAYMLCKAVIEIGKKTAYLTDFERRLKKQMREIWGLK